MPKDTEAKFVLFWTHSVTRTNFKIDKDEFSRYAHAQKKINEVRIAHRRDINDNAYLLA